MTVSLSVLLCFVWSLLLDSGCIIQFDDIKDKVWKLYMMSPLWCVVTERLFIFSVKTFKMQECEKWLC